MADEEKELKADTDLSAVAAKSTGVVTEQLDDTPTEPSTPQVVEPPRRKSGGGAWIGYGLLLVSVALAGGGWFILQELRSKQEGLGGQLSNRDQQILEVSRQVNTLQSELAALHTQLVNFQSGASGDDARFERMLADQSTQFTERLDHTQTELTLSINHIQHQLNKSRGDLMVADAEYLLSVANQKLHLIGDLKAVLAAMEAADQRLFDSGDPAVFKVREALADEIATLRSIDAPDIVGLSTRILILTRQAGSLPLFLPHAEMDKPVTPEAEPTPLGSVIKDLVAVRRTDRPVKAILSPEQAEALREVLQLRLEAIRTALLRTDEVLYQESLTAVIDWLKEHFDTSQNTTRDFLAELDKLKNIPIRAPLPDISHSLSLLRNIERLRLEVEQNSLANGTVKKPVKPKTPAKPAESASKPEADADRLEESGDIQ
ncbi:MAG: uroporphyrinogen-III C-methyltransferase [Methylococcaceae bacterium]